VFFQWTKNGRPLQESFKIENQESFSLLKFIKLHKNDSALYTCNAKNALASDSTSTKLIVHGTSNSISNTTDYLIRLKVWAVFKLLSY